MRGVEVEAYRRRQRLWWPVAAHPPPRYMLPATATNGEGERSVSLPPPRRGPATARNRRLHRHGASERGEVSVRCQKR